MTACSRLTLLSTTLLACWALSSAAVSAPGPVAPPAANKKVDSSAPPTLTAPIAAPDPGLEPVRSLPPTAGTLTPQLARALVGDHLEILGLSADDRATVLGEIDSAGAGGEIAQEAIDRAAALIPDGDMSEKAHLMLTAYAEIVTFGRTISAPLQVNGWNGGSTGGPDERNFELSGKEALMGGAITPSAAGTCKTCLQAVASADFTIDPSAVAIGTYQFHTSSTDTAGDCNWYRVLNVITGHDYEFATCPPGSVTWDSLIDVYTTGCVQVAHNDDGCTGTGGSASKVLWTSTVTGEIRVQLFGFSASHGGYTLAYRDLGITGGCETCASPGSTLPPPTPTCQQVAGSTTPACTSRYYNVQLQAGQQYTFTTCNVACPAAGANYDTKLNLYNPSCVNVISNDDAHGLCGNKSEITAYLAAVSGLHRIEVTGFGVAPNIRNGNFTLGYKRVSSGCADCGSGPYLNGSTPLVPTLSCQTVSGVVASCQDNWYTFNLTAGTFYEWTTCNVSGGCSGGTANFDTIIELWGPACGAVPVALDDNGCGAPLSKLTQTIATSGIYRVHVRGAGAAAGSYTMTYRLAIPCTAPTEVTVTPSSGNTSATSCSTNQSFAMAANGTRPTRFDWSVTAPAGGNAAPASGTVTSSTGGASFSSTLTASCRGRSFHIQVTATNDCGQVTTNATYTLNDITPPRVVPPPSTTVECDHVPGAGTPTVTDNCDQAPQVSYNQTRADGACPGSYVLTRTWTATDCSGNVSLPGVQTITVRDRTPPVIVPDTSNKFCLYPPNHDMVCFTQAQFHPTITDNCSPPITWRVVSITNSEATADCGSANHEPDVTIAPDGLSFCVRAERCGSDPAQNNGRLYTILATATDACGNTSLPRPIGTILVPHDHSDTSNCILPP